MTPKQLLENLRQKTTPSLSLKQMVESDADTKDVVTKILSDIKDEGTLGEIVFYTPRDLYDMQYVLQPSSGGLRPGIHHAASFLDVDIDNLFITNYSNDEVMRRFVQQITARGENITVSKADSEYWYGQYSVKGVRFLILTSGQEYSLVISSIDYDMLPLLFQQFSFRIGQANELTHDFPQQDKNESLQEAKTAKNLVLLKGVEVSFKIKVQKSRITGVKVETKLPDMVRIGGVPQDAKGLFTSLNLTAEPYMVSGLRSMPVKYDSAFQEFPNQNFLFGNFQDGIAQDFSAEDGEKTLNKNIVLRVWMDMEFLYNPATTLGMVGPKRVLTTAAQNPKFIKKIRTVEDTEGALRSYPQFHDDFKAFLSEKPNYLPVLLANQKFQTLMSKAST